MRENATRTGSPGVRLGLALLLSLALHTLVLLPWRTARPEPPLAPSPMPALDVTLLAPLLKTREAPPEPPPVPPAASPAAAPPVPRGFPSVTPLAKAPKPQPLTGRTLDAALAAIVREDFYPRAAIERGLEGRVVLLLNLGEGGQVTGIEVASSSGQALLDDAAVSAAGRIGRLPGGRRQVLLPVVFRLD